MKKSDPQSTHLFCMVCSKSIEGKRAGNANVTTCSPQCSKELKKRRSLMRQGLRCAWCNAPSTPEERKEFREWRRSKGQLKPQGRPRKLQPAPEQLVMANELTIH